MKTTDTLRTDASKYGPLKRGNYNKDKTKRFWGYYFGRELWMDIERFQRSTSHFYKYQTT